MININKFPKKFIINVFINNIYNNQHQQVFYSINGNITYNIPSTINIIKFPVY